MMLSIFIFTIIGSAIGTIIGNSLLPEVRKFVDPVIRKINNWTRWRIYEIRKLRIRFHWIGFSYIKYEDNPDMSKWQYDYRDKETRVYKNIFGWWRK